MCLQVLCAHCWSWSRGCARTRIGFAETSRSKSVAASPCQTKLRPCAPCASPCTTGLPGGCISETNFSIQAYTRWLCQTLIGYPLERLTLVGSRPTIHQIFPWCRGRVWLRISCPINWHITSRRKHLATQSNGSIRSSYSWDNSGWSNLLLSGGGKCAALCAAHTHWFWNTTRQHHRCPRSRPRDRLRYCRSFPLRAEPLALTFTLFPLNFLYSYSLLNNGLDEF